MHVGNYLYLVACSQRQLAEALESVGTHHQADPDVLVACRLLASWSRDHIEKLRPLAEKYGKEKDPEPERLVNAIFQGPRKGGLGLLRDLHDLSLIANEVQISSMLLYQAARALRDRDLEAVCTEGQYLAQRQLSWLTTRMKQGAPQALVATGS